MAVTKQFIHSFIAFWLIFALMLPTAIEISHGYECHDHATSSDEIAINFGEVTQDCCTFHFNLQSFNYSIISYIEIIELFKTNKVETHLSSLIRSAIIDLPQLRGPPGILC